MSSAAQIVASLKPRILEFHTRAMRREFFRRYGHLSGTTIPPHILRSIYSDLTLDASAFQNPGIDGRVRLAVLGEDPDLIVDLRHLNPGRPADTFDVFFEQLEKEVQDLMAADERRHNVEHLAKYISVRDLINQTKEKIPEGLPIPSEATVLFAFVPRNSHNSVSKLYKGRIPLRLKVQSRQLRASHIDDHYCAALFRYMREYAVKYREDVRFVCLDDKAKVDYGEPGMMTSSGVRGKKSIVPMNSTLACLDHDMQTKGSITPSVCLDVDVPEEIDSSFYRGQVTVVLKDSVFQPSSPIRHMVELQNILEQGGKPNPKILMIFTDGGPDHRVNYHSVKIALILLFKRMKLDMIIACRTAPGHSWINPAERVMSLLNLAMQNTALAREECSSNLEQVLKSCNSMADIRKKSVCVKDLKNSWLESVKPVKTTLEDRITRIELKGKTFICQGPASEEELQAFETGIAELDSSISVGKYLQANLTRADKYKKFLADHCQERTYSFQIRKCEDSHCCDQAELARIWLPDPVLERNELHYKPFAEVLGTKTVDTCPSFKKQLHFK